jgi:hypothetical protein
MNDVTYLEAARLLGARMIKEGGATVQQQIAFAFRLASSRRPTEKESQVLADSLRYGLARFRGKPETAAQYVSVGEYPRDPALDVTELAGYMTVASLILNLDSTITKD